MSIVHQVLWVGLGGFLRSTLRNDVGIVGSKASRSVQFSLSCLLVNLLGCFLIGLAAAYAQDEPANIKEILDRTVEQVRSNLSQVVDEYKNAKSPEKKFYFSMALSQLTQNGTFSEYPSVEKLLTASQKVTVQQAIKHHQETLGKVSAFEARLTAADVDLITQDNPRSIFRKFGRFGMQNFKACSDQDIYKVRKSISAEELYAGFSHINSLALIYEDLWMFEYRKRIREILSSDARFKAERDLTHTYYHDFVEAEEKERSLRELQKLKSENEKALLDSNRTIKDVQAYVAEKTWVSPECFFGFDQKFHDAIRSALTKDRGAWILRHITRKTKTLNDCEAFSQVYEKIREEPSVIKRSRNDAWGRPYRFKHAGGRCEMYSQAVSPETESDDIPITLH